MVTKSEGTMSLLECTTGTKMGLQFMFSGAMQTDLPEASTDHRRRQEQIYICIYIYIYIRCILLYLYLHLSLVLLNREDHRQILNLAPELGANGALSSVDNCIAIKQLSS